MKVTVDWDTCAATGVCAQICPDVFEVRKDGYLYILQENPAESLRKAVTEAMESCPTEAISIDG
jgi:ferredoxin